MAPHTKCVSIQLQGFEHDPHAQVHIIVKCVSIVLHGFEHELTIRQVVVESEGILDVALLVSCGCYQLLLIDSYATSPILMSPLMEGRLPR